MAIKTEFKMLWESKVKTVAIECVKMLKEFEDEDKRLHEMPENEEKASAIKELQTKANNNDLGGMGYIVQMINCVERDLIHDRFGLNSINLIGAVHGTLDLKNPTYWQNVWKDDFSSETAQNFRKLGELMPELMRVM